MTIQLLVIQSCSDKNKSLDTQIQPQTSIAGKIYGLTNPPIDSTICQELTQSNSAFQKLLFLDDSLFIQIIPSSCGDIGACTRYYSGKYKIDSEALLFTYFSKMVVHHVKSKNLITPYVELENSDFTKGKLVKHICKNILYFEECDVQGHLMTPKADTLVNEIKYLKDENIWGKLFDKK